MAEDIKTMRLKYFFVGKTKSGYGPAGIVNLKDGLLSIAKDKNNVIFREESGSHLFEEYTKEQVVALLQEVIDWLKDSKERNTECFLKETLKKK